jgi:hypothetical protein
VSFSETEEPWWEPNRGGTVLDEEAMGGGWCFCGCIYGRIALITMKEIGTWLPSLASHGCVYRIKPVKRF